MGGWLVGGVVSAATTGAALVWLLRRRVWLATLMGQAVGLRVQRRWGDRDSGYASAG